jgi:DNA-directed RNA polymerase subunit omega
VNASELALLQIANGAFVEDELAPYLLSSPTGA